MHREGMVSMQVGDARGMRGDAHADAHQECALGIRPSDATRYAWGTNAHAIRKQIRLPTLPTTFSGFRNSQQEVRENYPHQGEPTLCTIKRKLFHTAYMAAVRPYQW